jgi:TetR/AcrR family transcriptional regulator, transcriptional repressor of bet genes
MAIIPMSKKTGTTEPVDHEVRRRQIAQVAAEVVAREGVEAATVRHIAAQLGCSTTLITDCFEDKTDLLVSAYRYVSTNTLTQFEQSVGQSPAEILEGLVSLSAVDENSWCGWRVHVAFWEKAVRDPVLAAEQRACIASSRQSIERAISSGYGPGGDISGAAQLVIALIHGISIQVLFENESWSRDRIGKLLAAQIEMALGRGPLVARQRRRISAVR